MRPFRICWIVSRPRVGSMWCYNVARSIAADAGLTVLPVHAIKGDAETLAEGAAALDDPDPSRRRVLKSHQAIDPTTPDSLFIVPDRDPRDALVSLMRFAQVPFHDAVRMQPWANAVLDFYPPGERVLRLAYVEIDRKPATAVRRIAGFLGHAITPAKASAIADRWSRRAVARLIEASSSPVRAHSDDGSARVFDLETGFQTGHVSDYRDGDWRKILTPEQQDEVERRLGPWLRANGYETTAQPGQLQAP